MQGRIQDFPIGGGANPPLQGPPTYDFAKLCEKLHEIEKFLGRRKGGGRLPPKSATDMYSDSLF